MVMIVGVVVVVLTWRGISENRNIGALLREYGLRAAVVPLEAFMDPADISQLAAHIELYIITSTATTAATTIVASTDQTDLT
jgi:hypothetical protein